MLVEVFCQCEIEGIHNWPDCPIEEVEYLKYPHRHVFHIKANAKVEHDNRFIEFIELKHKIIDYINNKYWNEINKCCVFGPLSCEMIAKELIEHFNLSSCSVSEDGENGAIVVNEELAPLTPFEQLYRVLLEKF